MDNWTYKKGFEKKDINCTKSLNSLDHLKAEKVLKCKHAVKYKIKRSYENYLEGILGISNPADSTQDLSKSGLHYSELFSSKHPL